MLKRKCGTCRFFEDRLIAGSGWCTHPARQEIQHMVLVRKSELACRNFMDQVLWEPADDLSGIDDLSDTPIPDPNGISAELAPDISMEASRNGRNGKHPVSDHTDQITAIAIPVNPTQPQQERRNRVSFGADRGAGSASDGVPSVRDAQKRRQSELIERHRVTQAGATNDGSIDDPFPGSFQNPPEEPVQPSLAAEREQAVVPRRALLPPADAEDLADLIRPRAAERPPVVPPARTTPRDVPPAIAFKPDGSVETGVKLPEPAPPAPVTDVSNGTIDRQHTEPFVLVEPTSDVLPKSPAPAAASSTWSAPVAGSERNRFEEPFERPSTRNEHPRAGEVPAETFRNRRTETNVPYAPRTDVQQVPLQVDPIDADPRLSGIRRCCGTCRSFVPDGDGSRGRCRYAHAHVGLPVIKSDELACRSSFGGWWLPRDDLWLERADQPPVARPDPLMSGLAQTLVADRVGAGTQRRGEL